jgi:flagellar hook assembly protein FlgD
VESEFWPFFPNHNFDPWDWGQDPVSLKHTKKNMNGNILYRNYPNPFNTSTMIKYSLNKDIKVSLRIYNSSGRRVRTLVNKRQIKGSHTSVWDGRDNSGGLVRSGTYFLRLKIGQRTQIRKMVLVR